MEGAMRSHLFIVALAITMTMTVPTTAQTYLGAGPDRSTYTNRDDWRSQRNDWRKDSIDDWRKHRNDWQADYSKENERKDYAKDRRFGDDCSASVPESSTYANSYTATPCR
jgi:hypothetical protein